MKSIDDITRSLAEHYKSTIRDHGPNAKGVDWRLEETAEIGYEKMLAVILRSDREGRPSLLDVGCGYGGLLEFSRKHGIDIDYEGVDVVSDMIKHGQHLFPGAKFVVGDIFSYPSNKIFDYVVCSGILTQKLNASLLDMDAFANSLIRKMYSLCRRGIAFNVMSNRVNFMAPNLYYRSPVELLAFCLSELSTKVKIDHAYERFDFTTYVYRSQCFGEA